MLIKRFILSFIFLTICTFSYSLETALQVIQFDPINENVNTASYLIEDGIFDFFFSKGMIVSNVPCMTISDSSFLSEESLFETDAVGKAKISSLNEAETGGCEYLIIVLAEYTVSDRDTICYAQWELWDVNNRKCISNETGNPSSLGNKSKTKRVKNKFIANEVSDFAFELAQKVYSSIKANEQ
ncbi:MAG: hypothetical protein SO116_04255 [Treponema sp.]|nr:hypothetical protein [Treponema sp.]